MWNFFFIKLKIGYAFDTANEMNLRVDPFFLRFKLKISLILKGGGSRKCLWTSREREQIAFFFSKSISNWSGFIKKRALYSITSKELSVSPLSSLRIVSFLRLEILKVSHFWQTVVGRWDWKETSSQWPFLFGIPHLDGTWKDATRGHPKRVPITRPSATPLPLTSSATTATTENVPRLFGRTMHGIQPRYFFLLPNPLWPTHGQRGWSEVEAREEVWQERGGWRPWSDSHPTCHCSIGTHLRHWIRLLFTYQPFFYQRLDALLPPFLTLSW